MYEARSYSINPEQSKGRTEEILLKNAYSFTLLWSDYRRKEDLAKVTPQQALVSTHNRRAHDLTPSLLSDVVYRCN